MTVVSFKVPRDQGARLTTAMKRIALDHGEAVQDTYLRACTEFLTRHTDNGDLWRELTNLAARRGDDAWQLHRDALREYLDRHQEPTADGA